MRLTRLLAVVALFTLITGTGAFAEKKHPAGVHIKKQPQTFQKLLLTPEETDITCDIYCNGAGGGVTETTHPGTVPGCLADCAAICGVQSCQQI